jgi:hypothetical protein
VFALLQGLQYRIYYRKGSENGAADALSHHAHPDSLTTISSVKHQWIEEVVNSYQSDSVALDLIQ